MNRREETGRFNLSTQFPYYREERFIPDLSNTQLGKPVLFDMDMSAGDFLTLFYLLKVPVEIIDLKVCFCYIKWDTDISCYTSNCTLTLSTL